jgi:mono/diheme cytochrome c family protein
VSDKFQIQLRAPRAALALGAVLFLVPLLTPGLSYAQDLQGGADSFAKHCSGCHGPEARGGQGPSLLGPAYPHGVDDPSVTRTIRDGFPEGGMPAFGAVLSESQISGVVAFLRQKRAAAPAHPPGQPVVRGYSPSASPRAS